MATDAPRSRRERHELLSVVLLSVTAVATAWAAFQSSKWHGVQALELGQANAARTESVRASTEAGIAGAVDVELFVSYVEALASDEPEVAELLRERFPERLGTVVDAWLAMEGPDVPATPFELDAYVREAQRRALDLEDRALGRFDAAQTANRHSDDYVLTTVLFASVLLFAGVSTKLADDRARVALLVVGSVGFAVGAVVLVALPVQL